MTPDQNKARARQLLEELWNAHNPDAVDSFMARDFRQGRPLPGVENSREGLKDWVRMTTRAFPDIHFTIEEQLAEGNLVVTRWTARGTHKDSFLGIPATGKPVTVEGTSLARFADGKVISDHVQWDALGMMQQLGVVPEIGQAVLN